MNGERSPQPRIPNMEECTNRPTTMTSEDGSTAPIRKTTTSNEIRRSLSRLSLCSSHSQRRLSRCNSARGSILSAGSSANDLYRELCIDNDIDIGKNHGHACPMIKGRESHTADLYEFDRYVSLLEDMQRPEGSLPYDSRIWAYVRSVLESARPVGFNELDDPTACVPKGPDDAGAFVQKVVSISEVNPIQPALLAENGGFAEDAVVTEMLYATKLGIVRMQWAPECDRCGSAVCARDELGELPASQHCEGCGFENGIDSMDRIKVLFLLNPDILYVLADNYACTPSKDALAKTSVFAAVPATYTGSGFRYSVGSGDGELGPALDPGTYRMHCPVAKTDNYLVVKRGARDDDEPHALSVKVSDVVYDHGSGSGGGGGNNNNNNSKNNNNDHSKNKNNKHKSERKTLVAPHGKIHFDIMPDTRSFFVLWVQEDLDDDVLMRLPEDERTKYTAATHVLHNDVFNHLFSDQVVSSDPDALLSIENIVLVFTDVVGSTDLYANLGDGPALRLVRKHFQILFGAFTQHRGRVIKTVGDAVMASFTTGRAAMEAVADVFRILPKQCLLPSGEPLQIRVGIHCGPAVVVPLNGVNDYFGQTVNIAARVESAAKASECFVTEDVLSSDPDCRSAYYEIVASSYVKRRSSSEASVSSGPVTDEPDARAAAATSLPTGGKRMFVPTPETELHLKGVSGAVRARGFRLLLRPRRMSDVNVEPTRTYSRSDKHRRKEVDEGGHGDSYDEEEDSDNSSDAFPPRPLGTVARSRRSSTERYMSNLNEEDEADEALDNQFALPESALQELEEMLVKGKH